MRILVATGIYPPDIGGPATYSKLLKDELPNRGIDVDVVSFGSVRHLPKGLSHFVYFLKVYRKGGHADVLYAQDPVSVGLPTMRASQLLHKPFVLKVVGDYAWEQGKQRFGVTDNLDEFASKNEGYDSRVVRLKKVQKKVAKCADKIIVPSNYLKRIVSKWGIDEEKINVVYNSFEPPQSIEKKEVEGDPVIVSVGRLVPWKGFIELISVMSAIREKFADVVLYIVGDGPDREKIEKTTEEKNLGRHVHLVGKCAHDELLGYLSSADLFVLNTGYEGFSHVLIEAMSLGAAIVTTEVGGNTELIEDEKNGILVKYGDEKALQDALLRTLSDRGTRERFADNAKKTVTQFSKKRMLNETVTILKQVCECS